MPSPPPFFLEKEPRQGKKASSGPRSSEFWVTKSHKGSDLMLVFYPHRAQTHSSGPCVSARLIHSLRRANLSFIILCHLNELVNFFVYCSQPGLKGCQPWWCVHPRKLRQLRRLFWPRTTRPSSHTQGNILNCIVGNHLNVLGTSLVVQWLRLLAYAGSLCSISGQETRSHMPWPRVCMLQLKDPAGCNEDRRTHTPQLRPDTAK